ncbi:kinesin-like protein KIN-10A [Apium graveolens]|uniref:kinesin-like protein KIN-10A n=1 Tax=Apium graveolens TaxID=4045 RepID=UPI003D7ADAC9
MYNTAKKLKIILSSLTHQESFLGFFRNMGLTPKPKPHTNSTPTGSSKSNSTHILRTPKSKHNLNFNLTKPSPNPKETLCSEHPIEVIARIRDHNDKKQNPISALIVNSGQNSIRVKTEFGYRDFSLDGVSVSENENLDVFYKSFVESRINAVKLGDKCTIMMYGPTGSGKSYTMFGGCKQQGIVYKALRGILGCGDEGADGNVKNVGSFVQVTVLEIYNEEIYDLLSNGGGGFWSKGNASKVRLEVMGKKAKNATFISGNEATKISKEIQKVEKRRIVKSTLCNERSSRSHCMIILDVPTVGGRLMLVDMAGSENIEQAGQIGLEAKMQATKINQGNIALKRVVESIANGDSHVPFRDSKLTMLLQDSFEDEKSKILMVLCASPDQKEMHKTIATLEYGAKAKCIVRGPHTPIKDKGAEDSSSAVILGSRIEAMDQFIYKLQMENKIREKERNDAQKELVKKEEEISALRAKLMIVEEKGPVTNEEEVICLKVNEQTAILKTELEDKIQECQRMADALVEMERRKMEEKILQQQQELEVLRQRLEDIESELQNSREKNRSVELEGSNFAKKLLEIYTDEDPGMEKSMDLDKSLDLDMGKRDVVVSYKTEKNCIGAYPHMSESGSDEDANQELSASNFASKTFLSTVYEDEEEEVDEDDGKENLVDEVLKEVIQEKTVCTTAGGPLLDQNSVASKPMQRSVLAPLASQDTAVARQMRIQNIFTLCGSHRELSHHKTPSIPSPTRSVSQESQLW